MKVLFVSYGAGHVAMCLPVMRALRAMQPGCEVRLLALTTAFGEARRAGEQPLGYRDFCRGPDAARALRYGEQLAGAVGHPEVPREESIAYLGFNFLEWVEDEGEARAWDRWQAAGRGGFLPVRFLTRVLQEVAPDVVVTTNSPRSEAAAIQAAAGLGIPSLSMVDLFALPGDQFAVRSTHATRITVLSEGTRSNLMRAGVDGARIFVTGNPAFDALASPEALVRGRQWREARGWQDGHVILWAGHKEPADARPAQWAGTGLGQAVQDRLVEFVLAREDCRLAVRYHPNEWPEFAPVPEHPRLWWSRPDREPLEPVLLAAQQVVVQATTVGAQAFAARKRVVCLTFSPTVQRTGMDYATLGMAEGAADIDELAPVVASGLGWDEESRMKEDGAAAAKVACHIVALAREGAGR